MSPSPPSPAPVEAAACAACGAALVGPYCHACGERRPRPDDERLGRFLKEQFHEVTSADGRLWRSVRALAVPGKLTNEYLSGRRTLYLRPIRLFLVTNILFFLWIGVIGGQGFRGDARLYRSHEAFSARMTEAAAEAGVEAARYDAAFTQRAEALAPTMIAVWVPLFALAFALVLAPARRPAVRHVVFATHAVAGFMAVAIGVTLALAVPVFAVHALSDDASVDVGDSVLVPVILAGWVGYLVAGVRRVYGVPWWGAAAAGLLVATGGTHVVLEAYRVVLFFVTLWTLDVPA